MSTPTIPTIVLLGADGQLGWELRRALLPLGTVHALTRTEVDLARPQDLLPRLDALQPQVVVNAAAYTAVDRAEQEPELAQALNAALPALLATWATAHGAWLLHYSTDYVFDGAKQGAYTEGDAPNPINVYGRTKLAGEQAIQGSAGRHLILRTSWVYAARGGNFAKTMLRLAAEREQLTVVADQFGAPTAAELIADVSSHLLRQLLAGGGAGGLYHLTASGHTSWHGYAQFVLQQAASRGLVLRCGAQQLRPIASAEYPSAALRPANSRLDCSRLQRDFGLSLPPWQTQVERLLAEIV